MSVLSAFALRATADGPPLAIPPVADGPPGAISAMADSRSSQRERRLERETGIEPATNSLEGCDSTTELLPPSRFRATAREAAVFFRATAGLPAPAPSRNSRDGGKPPRDNHSLDACVSERRLVAREGLEPSKPLGRQIYSLLRLTAPQPRQLSAWESSTSTLTLGESSPTPLDSSDGAGEGI
jgi:hypothetical protein